MGNEGISDQQGLAALFCAFAGAAGPDARVARRLDRGDVCRRRLRHGRRLLVPGPSRYQAVADASALAGAQELPANTSGATTVAQLYSTKNGGGVTQISFSTSYLPMDTITVRAERTAPGFLSKVLGISSVNVGADSVARVYNLGSAKYAAPFGVDRTEPMLNDCGGPCFGSGYPTTLDLLKVGPGSFKIINIDGSQGGTGPSTLADWINGGLSGTMDVGWYWGDPGAKFNSSEVKGAMEARLGSDILLPVYDQVLAQGRTSSTPSSAGQRSASPTTSSRGTRARSPATSCRLPGRARPPKTPATTSGRRS